MLGMETMSSAVAPLADNEQFKSILTMFSNPVLGVIAGAVLTAVIQSSSASVGVILQAMCATGAVTYSTALPIIMGRRIQVPARYRTAFCNRCKQERKACRTCSPLLQPHRHYSIYDTVLCNKRYIPLRVL